MNFLYKNVAHFGKAAFDELADNSSFSKRSVSIFLEVLIIEWQIFFWYDLHNCIKENMIISDTVS